MPDEGAHYVELGCGVGLGALIIAASNPSWRVTALDFNPAHIAAARAMALEAGITNGAKAADNLVGGTSPIAAKVEVHIMNMDGGVMRMRPLKDGLAIPAGQTVALKPGGLHVMFMSIKAPFKEGETVKATLTFEKAGTIDVEFKVDSAKPGDDAHMNHKM